MSQEIPQETLLEESEGLLKPRPIPDDMEMDITPMIDITFLLLIFFLVCSTTAEQVPVKLPQAVYGTSISEKMSFTVLASYREGTNPQVSIVRGHETQTLPDDPETQADELAAAVSAAKEEGIEEVLLKIDKKIKQKHLDAIRQAIGREEGVRLYMAVDDKGKK